VASQLALPCSTLPLDEPAELRGRLLDMFSIVLIFSLGFYLSFSK
jgi:hypothetical protein